jgi:hypothetical protein
MPQATNATSGNSHDAAGPATSLVDEVLCQGTDSSVPLTSALPVIRNVFHMQHGSRSVQRMILAGILGGEQRTMGRHRYIREFLNAALYLLVCCLANYHPSLLVGGCVKLVASLLFACLVSFVVVHSPNICRLVAACFRVLPLLLISSFVDRRWIALSQTNITTPNEPGLSPLFQRPPPLFSF